MYIQETKELYTGPKTLQMIGAPSHKVKRPELVKYRVFVQNAGGGARCVKGGTYVLYEVSSSSMLMLMFMDGYLQSTSYFHAYLF